MKRDINDLALFGGRAAFLHPHTDQPGTFDRTRLFDRMTWAFGLQWPASGGPLVREFEDRRSTSAVASPPVAPRAVQDRAIDAVRAALARL